MCEPTGKLEQEGSIEFVFGGTFDPVHFGHIAIIQSLESLAPEIAIRILPCSIPALKSKPMSSFDDRVNMLRLATKDFNNTLIDQRENTREGASFMVDTLEALRMDFSDRVFILVMGADSFSELTRWHQWKKLSSLCHIAVLNRPGKSFLEIKSELDRTEFRSCDTFNELAQQTAGLVFIHQMSEKNQSSTQIRRSFRQYYENNLELDSMLPQSVIKYAVKHHLYK